MNANATVLPTMPLLLTQNVTKLHASMIEWKRINNAGLVIGDRCFKHVLTNNVIEFIPELITWSPQTGIKQYRITCSSS